MRASMRLVGIVLAATVVLLLLACGGDDDVEYFVKHSATSTAQASGTAIQPREPTPTPVAAASGGIRRESPPPPLGGGTGAISGALSYPSEVIPAQRVVAFAVDGGGWWSVDTATGDRQYTLAGLPPGAYRVVAYLIEPGLPALAAGYSQFVLFGGDASCTDHSLVEVAVTAGQTTGGIDTGDWYAPDGSFPPDPSQ